MRKSTLTILLTGFGITLQAVAATIPDGTSPILTYSTKVGKSHLDFNARYVHEFDNRNRPEGDLFQFSATLKF